VRQVPDGDAAVFHGQAAGALQHLERAVADSLRELTRLRVKVVFVPALPNDGKVISDERKHD